MGLAVLLGAAAAVFLPCLTALPLIRGEAMFALIPKEMLDAGNWLTPTLNGVPYLDKPPLLYWLTAVSYQIFGVSEWAARVPNLLCALGEIWFTCLIGAYVLNRRAAWLGGFILFTSVGFFSQHLIIYLDHLISLSLVASLYCFLRWRERFAIRWASLFYLCLTAGFLSKGLVGLVFPVLICSIFAVYPRRPGTLALFFSPWGWAVFLLLVTPWLAAMEINHPGFLRHYFVNEQIMRFLGQRQPMDINSFSLPGFWLLFGIWLLPWTPLLPEALYRFWREAAAGPAPGPSRLILIWPAVILGFFTLSSSRIEYYSLPALPALSLVLGWRLQRLVESQRDRSLSGALLLLAVAGVLITVCLPYLENLFAANRRECIGLFELIQPVARRFLLVIPPLAALGALAGRRRPSRGLAVYGILAVAMLFFTFKSYSAISPLVSDKIPGEYIRSFAGPDDLVIMESIEEFEYGASLAFYADRRILLVKRGELPQFPYPVPAEQNYLIPPNLLKELWRGPHRVFILADEVLQLEAYLSRAPVQVAFTGKRLLVNRNPQLAENPLRE
ncbi:MAG: glycosyltransferase family 39 protein [Deltaproteobacteria bacterium]|nr:glycosyltransferase family 39 protein [Deltaproteobacteria bacterium]